MAADDDDKPRKKITHEIGQGLYLLSVEELAERIALLTAEIERLQEARTKKPAPQAAARSFLKPGPQVVGAEAETDNDRARDEDGYHRIFVVPMRGRGLWVPAFAG